MTEILTFGSILQEFDIAILKALQSEVCPTISGPHHSQNIEIEVTPANFTTFSSQHRPAWEDQLDYSMIQNDERPEVTEWYYSTAQSRLVYND
jgi:hypothetical protein